MVDAYSQPALYRTEQYSVTSSDALEHLLLNHLSPALIDSEAPPIFPHSRDSDPPCCQRLSSQEENRFTGQKHHATNHLVRESTAAVAGDKRFRIWVARGG